MNFNNFNEADFDEYGRLIQREEINENDIEENNIVFQYAELSKDGSLTLLDNCVIKNDVDGAIFILNGDDSLIGKDVILSLVKNDSVSEAVWESEIIKVSSDIFRDNYGKNTYEYMVKKSLNSKSFLAEEGLYTIEIKGTNLEKVMIISFDEDVRFENVEEDVVIQNATIEEENIKDECSLTYEEQELGSLQKDLTEEDMAAVVEAALQEEVKVNAPIEFCFEAVEENKIKYLTNSFLGLEDIEISISDKLEESKIINGNIIIEKLKDQYVATIHGLAYKKINLIEGESKYFKFEYGIDNFIVKVKKILTQMQLLDDEEKSELKIIVVTDEEYVSEEQNVEVILRKDAFRLMNVNGVNTIRMYDEKVELFYAEENGRNINASVRLDNEGNNEDIERLISEISEKLNGNIEIFDEININSEFEVVSDRLIK